MCTVSYLPTEDGYIITHNRDEKSKRKTADFPEIYNFNQSKVIYPVDPVGKGTWIALLENGNAYCLLNGGFEFHQSNPPYKISRGQIIISLIQYQNIFDFKKEFDFKGIEPFTLIVYENKNLYDCRWDGNLFHFKALEINKAHFWSSATLYSPEIRQQRLTWFEHFLTTHSKFESQSALTFHKTGGNHDQLNGLIMNRDNNVYTVSITQIEINRQSKSLYYEDLIEQKQLLLKFEN